MAQGQAVQQQVRFVTEDPCLMTIDTQCQGGQVLGGYEWPPGARNEEGRFGNSVWGTRGQTA